MNKYTLILSYLKPTTREIKKDKDIKLLSRFLCNTNSKFIKPQQSYQIYNQISNIKNNSGMIIATYHHGKIIGSTISKTAKKYSTIESINVDQKYQKKGIGTKTLQKTIQYTEKKNISSIFTSTISIDNYASMKLFSKAGFELEDDYMGGVQGHLTTTEKNTNQKIKKK
jgi:N-acetylglutamate synthase-like GNAT family acetyltransferase